MMSLTSQQKYYIKRNFKTKTVFEISKKLNIPEKKIRIFIEKRLGKKTLANPERKPSQRFFANASFQEINLALFVEKNIGTLTSLFLLVFFTYFNSLGGSFVSDDIPSILKNEDIGNIKSIFSNFSLLSIRNFFYFIFYKTTGLSPYPFHILNLLFHLGSTFLVYAILKITNKNSVAFLAAAIFAVHPILIESVSWISGGLYSQYSFFLLLSFLFYILPNKKNKTAWSLLFFALALTSSEKAVVFPFILGAYELSLNCLKKNWKKLLSFATFGFLTILMLLFKLGPKVSGLEAMSYQEKGLNNPFIQIPVAVGTYLKLIFWPQKLSLYQTEMSFSTVQYTIFIFVFLIFAGAIFYSWKKNRAIFFWLSFFIIAMSPTLTPLKVAWIVAERYVYLGSIGIFVIVAMFFDWLVARFGQKDERYKFAIYSVFAVIIIALSVRTVFRNMDWQSEDSLWIATAKTSPSGPNTHNNMGDVYSRHGDLKKAAEEFSKAIELNPLYADAYHNLGITYIKMGETSKAAEALQKSLQINPDLWQSYQNLAVIYFNQGDYAKALEYSKRGLEINPQDPTLNQNLKLIEDKLK